MVDFILNEEVRKQRCYFNWGLEEIGRLIEENEKLGSPMDDYDVINLFIDRMERYAAMNPNTSNMFSCAADAGRYRLDGFIAIYM